MLRSILFVIWIYGTMVVLAFLCLPWMAVSRAGAREPVRFWIRGVRQALNLIIGAKTEYRGLENIPEGGLLIASKHQCMYDAFTPWLVLSDPAIIIKRELLWYPIFGWYAFRSDMIPIDRGGRSKTLKRMYEEARKRTDKGRQVLIFPEGTRRAPGAPPAYKSGVYALYKDLGVPCVPVAHNAGLCWPAHGVRRRRGRMTFEYLPALPPGLSKEDFMQRLEAAIEPACERLLNEGLAAQGRARTDLAEVLP
ncbi:MAG: lysophospholipid acyltransferase family protein [Pseudomonadota bacterium]